jgi:Leucine-rich repeat (LRR) protein
MLSSEETHILKLLCTCQPENVALAEALAKGLNINLLGLLEQEGFNELGIYIPSYFGEMYFSGNFSGGRAKITNLRALKYFPHLTALKCSGHNSLCSLEGIEVLTQLKVLNCERNKLTNLDELADLKNIKKIFCDYNPLNNLEVIKQLPLLETFWGEAITLDNLDFFANAIHLQSLDITHNRVQDLSPISHLKNINFLRIRNNPITDISAVANMQFLRFFFCARTKISDLSPCFELPNLKEIRLGQNDNLSRTEIDLFKKHQPNCKIVY